MSEQDQENISEDDFQKNQTISNHVIPERHGCVTAWLIFMLVINSVAALIYLFQLSQSLPYSKISPPTLMILVIVGAFNIYFSIKLLQYKKSAFYGFATTTIISFVINLLIGISPVMCVIGLSGIAILYGILQIKKDGISAWTYLK